MQLLQRPVLLKTFYEQVCLSFQATLATICTWILQLRLLNCQNLWIFESELFYKYSYYSRGPIKASNFTGLGKSTFQ